MFDVVSMPLDEPTFDDVAALCAEAFSNSNLYGYLLRNDEQRRVLSLHWRFLVYLSNLKTWQAQGKLTSTGSTNNALYGIYDAENRLVCVSVWVPPTCQWDQQKWSQYVAEFELKCKSELTHSNGAAVHDRFEVVDAYFADDPPVTTTHYYLLLLATAKEYRGKSAGLATKLLNHCIATFVDPAGMGVYLDCDSAALSTHFYAKNFGFQLVKTGILEERPNDDAHKEACPQTAVTIHFCERPPKHV